MMSSAPTNANAPLMSDADRRRRAPPEAAWSAVRISLRRPAATSLAVFSPIA
jgi:hypothetical protein